MFYIMALCIVIVVIYQCMISFINRQPKLHKIDTNDNIIQGFILGRMYGSSQNNTKDSK